MSVKDPETFGLILNQSVLAHLLSSLKCVAFFQTSTTSHGNSVTNLLCGGTSVDGFSNSALWSIENHIVS